MTSKCPGIASAKSRWNWSFACLFLLMTGATFGKEGVVKPDETVIFYPTAASLATNHNMDIIWHVPVRVNLCKIKKRSVALTLFRPLLGLDKDEMTPDEFHLYQERMRLLLVDNHRGRTIALEMPGLRTNLPPTRSNGHAESVFSISADEAFTNHLLSIQIPTNATQGRIMAGKVQLIPPSCPIVISDLDDTLRIAEVLNKKELMKNTFCRPFKPVEGMAALYRQWNRDHHAAFYYVSASPWQLYPLWQEFMREQDFPDGAFHMKTWSTGNTTFFSLFQKPDVYKYKVFSEILSRYPQNQYILVGDSGERDPEVYGRLAREYPDKVLKIFIRKVPRDSSSTERFKKAFQDVPTDHWMLFDHPQELEGKF